MKNRKILVMGLPCEDKTRFVKRLVELLNAVHFNADEIRQEIHKDLGFSEDDRTEQARRLSWLCDQVVAKGHFAVTDIICPTSEARVAFGNDATVIWVDRTDSSEFADTDAMFTAPESCDVHITSDKTPEYWAERVCNTVRPHFDPKAPTAMFVGRYQPFHDGHKTLILEGLRRVGQVCIAVRDTQGTDAKNPFDFEYVKSRIESGLTGYEGKFMIVPIPNITNIFYGRDVGYTVERIHLDETIEDISATKNRKAIFGGEQDEYNVDDLRKKVA